MMDVKTLLLGALSNQSMTGYELKKLFSISFAYFSGLSFGSIYPALKKMEEQGLITMQLQVQQNAPNRKVYTITPAGKAAFMQALRSPFGPEKRKNSFLMRMFFFACLSPAERLSTAQEYLESIRSPLNELKTVQPEIEAAADQFQFLCFQFGIRFLEDLARNVEHVIDALKNIQHNEKSQATYRLNCP
jgi:DNA-binding PadR family transcriptional regulator